MLKIEVHNNSALACVRINTNSRCHYVLIWKIHQHFGFMVHETLPLSFSSARGKDVWWWCTIWHLYLLGIHVILVILFYRSFKSFGTWLADNDICAAPFYLTRCSMSQLSKQYQSLLCSISQPSFAKQIVLSETHWSLIVWWSTVGQVLSLSRWELRSLMVCIEGAVFFHTGRSNIGSPSGQDILETLVACYTTRKIATESVGSQYVNRIVS